MRRLLRGFVLNVGKISYVWYNDSKQFLQEKGGNKIMKMIFAIVRKEDEGFVIRETDQRKNQCCRSFPVQVDFSEREMQP